MQARTMLAADTIEATTSPRMVERAEIYRRICVRDPYFAFEALAVAAGGSVSTPVTVTQGAGRETTPITVAETCRHLAILGSCAAALQQPDAQRRFYLTTGARVTRHGAPRRAMPTLVGVASPTLVERRRARAFSTLLDEGGLLFSLDVEYAVLEERSFERVFRSARMDDEAVGPAPAEIHVVSATPQRALACMRVERGHCRGHFPRYPMLPVAVLVQLLVDTAGACLARRWGEGVRFAVVSGELAAWDLARAGETVALEASHEQTRDRRVTLACNARTGDREACGGILVVDVEPA